MKTLSVNYSKLKGKDGNHFDSLSLTDFNKFNSDILNLGAISKDGKYFEALAAIYDLENFTLFCNQIDPHLVIPEYLNHFLRWLFREISDEFIKEKQEKYILLWGRLPFFAKFMGDGVLFLWDTTKLGLTSIGNIVVSLQMICDAYEYIFLPISKKDFVKFPPRLRCGIARGQIISIGDGNDYVGPCINVAARLQKIGQLSFVFSRRGFNPVECFSKENQKSFIPKKVAIRGIGSEELILVDKDEFTLLSRDEKKLFSDP